MKTKQPEALRLADALEEKNDWYVQPTMLESKAADELRRLHSLNQELLGALKLARSELAGLPHSLGYEFDHIPAIDATIAKAQEQK